MPVTLLLGGARSGKSRIAVERAAASARPVTFVATARTHPADPEWSERIARHVAERPAHWETVEAPLDLCRALPAIDARSFVIVDCLTLWLANLMSAEEDVGRATGELCALLARTRTEVVLISNEVGLGIVPDTPLGRAFRDAQGRLNQQVAAVAARVELVAAGIPIVLKPARTEEALP